MKPTQNQSRWTNESRSTLRASVGLVDAIRQIVGALDGVKEVRVLHRTGKFSKFFVILATSSVATINRVVEVMVQLEEAFPQDEFDYDTVPEDRITLVPEMASVLARG